MSGTWSLTWHGVRTVAWLELRQRVRSSRWLVVLALWVVAVGLVTWLTDVAVGVPDGAPAGLPDPSGGVMFSVVAFFVLSLGVLVAPALSATSVNGDRAAGTLATLQVTLLSPAEIAVGKLLAAWTVALAFLGTAVPFVLWAYLSGGTPFGRVLSALAVIAVVLGVVCAIGLGWSALTARTATSAVMTYLSVAALCVGSVILFGLTTPLVAQQEQVQVRTFDGTGTCTVQPQTMNVLHTERNWWLLALSPYVVVADAAPAAELPPGMFAFDPLSAIRDGVRLAKAGPPDSYDWCPDPQTGVVADERPQDGGAVWPWGLGANLLIGAGAVALTVRRLRTPTRTLPRGTRVA